MIGIKGEYWFIINEKVILHGENLITLLGESFFLNRWVNDGFEPIKYIVLGKSESRPLKMDSSLGKQTVSKNSSYKVDLTNKKLILSCDCSAEEVLGTCEIGVSNGEVLISHDVYKPISTEILSNNTASSVHIEYAFNIICGSIRSEWKASTMGNNIYYIYEPNQVVGVLENNTGSGYTRKNSVEEMMEGTYYYDFESKNLYIKNTSSTDPNNCEMIVQTK